MNTGISERAVIGIIAAIQFVNIVEFMMVAPLGPDFVTGFGMASADIGLVAGSYTAAAALATIISAAFLDRFERRKALVLGMMGLAVGTAAGGFAYDLYSLIAARVVAGIFGGPATALALAMIADVVAPERRGKAMGVVMSAFSIASVLGVPLSLELARVAGWHMPFLAVAALGLVVSVVAWKSLPKPETGLGQAPPMVGLQGIRDLVGRPEVLLSLCATALGMVAGFLLIPSISVYFQFNLGYPRESISVLYLTGGLVTLLTMWLAGRWTDRIGAVPVSAGATALLLLTIYVGFVHPALGVPVILIFVMFMVAMSTRNVAATTLNSQVAPPSQRGAFLAMSSAVQNICASIGALISTLMLGADADGKLVGVEGVAYLSMVLAVALPTLLWGVNRRLANSIRH